nr:hypothetical protein [Tanacetum cinerariifolium]
VKTVNDNVRLQALVDGKKVIVNEASIRCDLRLDDAEGTTCLPNAAIFEQLARIGLDDAEGTTCLPNAAIFEQLARIGNALVLKLLPGTNLAALWHLQSSALPIIRNATFPNTFLKTW